ncbi:MAG: hypothetical protein AAF988_01540 [Pseudomonadota bacterium]
MASTLSRLSWVAAATAALTIPASALADTQQCVSDLATDTNELADRYVTAVEDYAKDLGFFQKLTAGTIITGVNLACESVENMGHRDVGFCIAAIFDADDQTGDDFQAELEELEQRWVEIRDRGTCTGPTQEI